MRFIPLLFVFAHLACSTNYLVSDTVTGEEVVSLQELNVALREQEATIEFMDGSTTVARQVEVGADTVTWFGLRGGPRQSAGRGKVQSIVIREIGRGVLEGLGIGAGIGAGAGSAKCSLPE